MNALVSLRPWQRTIFRSSSLGGEFWGRSIASAALSLLLRIELTRPLVTHIAEHNLGSIRVFEKAGFTRVKDVFSGRNVFTGKSNDSALNLAVDRFGPKFILTRLRRVAPFAIVLLVLVACSLTPPDGDFTAPLFFICCVATLICLYFAVTSWENERYRLVRYLCLFGAVAGAVALVRGATEHNIEARLLTALTLVVVMCSVPLFPFFRPVDND